MGFLEIYKIGESKNTEALASMKGSIDEFEQGGTDSAVSRLAFEGKFSSMEFLLSHGASINEAVKGAARGKHKNYVKALLERGADISWAAVGAISGGDRSFAEYCIEKGAAADWVAYENARLGHTDLYSPLEYSEHLAEGAASGGYSEDVDGLIIFGANPDPAVRGAAQGGHKDYAEELLARRASIDFAAQGAAQGGHRDYAEELLTRRASIHFAAQGAAQGGHSDYANELLGRGADINLVAQGAAQGGQHAYAVALLSKNSLAIPDAKAPLIKALVSGAIDGKQISATVNSQLRWLSFFPPQMIPYLCTNIRGRRIFTIDESTEARAIEMSNHMRQNSLIYPDAYFITGPDVKNMMLTLALLGNNLPLELIIKIQQSLYLEPVTSKSYETLTAMRERFFAQKSERESTSISPIPPTDSGLGPTPVSPSSPNEELEKEFDLGLEPDPKEGSKPEKGPG